MQPHTHNLSRRQSSPSLKARAKSARSPALPPPPPPLSLRCALGPIPRPGWGPAAAAPAPDSAPHARVGHGPGRFVLGLRGEHCLRREGVPVTHLHLEGLAGQPAEAAVGVHVRGGRHGVREAGGHPGVLPLQQRVVCLLVGGQEEQVLGQRPRIRKVVCADDGVRGGRVELAVLRAHVHGHGSGHEGLEVLFGHVVRVVGVLEREGELVRPEHVDLVHEAAARHARGRRPVLVVVAGAEVVHRDTRAHKLANVLQPAVVAGAVGDDGHRHGVGRLGHGRLEQVEVEPAAVAERHVGGQLGRADEVPAAH
mmetsp:Transcript_21840/g.83123  ORF Transcript_21840/g.83123 Transcript_21840/m.83123 type:complete len:310 (-) Transcript_21840:229-1158(-)